VIDDGGRFGGNAVLAELVEERLGFVTREPPGGLSLVEAHRAARVPEVAVAGGLEQLEQLLHLSTCGRGSCLLSKCHVGSLTPGL
jgi:hypothetical protein